MRLAPADPRRLRARAFYRVLDFVVAERVDSADGCPLSAPPCRMSKEVGGHCHCFHPVETAAPGWPDCDQHPLFAVQQQ